MRDELDQRIWLDTTSSALDEDAITLTGLTRQTAPGKTHLYGVPDDLVLPYDNNGVIRLVIIDPGGDGNWVDNMFTMRLVTAAAETADPIPPSPSPASFIVSVTDKDPQPAVSFSESSLSLTEGTATAAGYEISVKLTAGNPRITTDDPANMGDLTNNVQFVASPAGAIVFADGDGSGCVDTRDSDVLSLTLGSAIAYDTATKRFTVSDPVGVLTDSASFEVEACGDKSGFRDGAVTFSFVESRCAARRQVW